MNLDFLKNVELLQPEKKVVRVATVKTPEEGFRLFKDGSVYPSEKLISLLDLEYTNKEAQGGYGLDIIDSRKWGMVAGKLPQALIFAAVVAKKEPKVDIFSSTNYDEEGSPLTSVLNQGAKTFGKNTLIPLLEEVYKFTFSEERRYVDLNLDMRYPMVSSTGVYHLPKVVTAGPRKGEDTYVRRENITVYPLVLVQDQVENSTEAEVVCEDTFADANPIGGGFRPITLSGAEVEFDTQEVEDETEDWATLK